MQLRYLVFPAFLIVCFLVFMGTASYGYVTDYLGWLNSYRDGSYKDVLHCFGYPGNHQFFHLINYTLYLLIGKHQWAMGVVFILSHASLCYLIYRTFRYLMEMLEVDDLRTLHAAFAEDVADVWSIEASVERRDVAGGTSRRAVEAQIAALRASVPPA